MSEFHVEVVKVGVVKKLANSDNLSITDVHGGYPVIFRTGDFKEGDLAVYVPVDAIVPGGDARWAFLGGHDRIKAKRLRGTFSQGLLTPLPWAVPAHEVGENMQAALGITKYEPSRHTASGKRARVFDSNEHEKDPGFMPKYTDLEGLRRYGSLIEIGEQVVIAEKTHGMNARFLWKENRLWVGSHERIKRRPSVPTSLDKAWYKVRELWFQFAVTTFFRLWDVIVGIKYELPAGPRPLKAKKSDWWDIAERYELESKLRDYPDCVVFGEIYGGGVQDLDYGSAGETKLVVFDVLDIAAVPPRYLDHDKFIGFCGAVGLPTVPVLYRGPWFDDLKHLAEGTTRMPGVPKEANHIREGFVVRPVVERRAEHFGRVILKLVGEGYLTRKDA